MTSAPEITVVVTTLNRRRWLERCVHSVLGQEGVTFDLVIVDDGSTDATQAYLSTLDDPRASVIRHAAPSGMAAPRNSGLAAARGDLVMFLDDDDWLERGALRALREGLDEHPKAVAAIGARRVWFTTEDYARRDSHPHSTRVRNVLDDLLAGWSTVSGQNLYRTALVRQVGGFDTSLPLAEDRDLWLRMAVLGPVVLRPEVVTTYRVHSGQSHRPPHIRDVREEVALRAIRALPRDEQRGALRIRRTTWLLDEAESAFTSGRVSSGVADTLRAVANTPTLFLSSLVGPWTVRRLAGRLARRFVFPARG